MSASHQGTTLLRPNPFRGTVPRSSLLSALFRAYFAPTTLALSVSLCINIGKSQAADSSQSDLQAAPEMLLEHQVIERGMEGLNADSLAYNTRGRTRSQSDLSKLDVVDGYTTTDGTFRLSTRPRFTSMIGGRYASITPNNQIVFYTLDPDLQMFVEKLVREARSPHLAIVAINPKTGAILAMKGKSETIPDPALHSGFPAASLFKVVTAAAAVEEAGIRPDSLVAFRGGTYTLNEYNYLPDPRRDRRVMSVGEAMGRSCNPVFGHLSTKYLDGSILARYASRFGFNRNLKFDAPLPSSSADIPDQDLFELSRTGAGFRGATISPVHAAALVAGLRDGQLRRPYTIDSVVTIDGVTMSKTRPEILQPIVEPSTAKTLLEMMRYTTTVGTSRREFMRGARPTLRELDVGAKTGTLKGTNPSGLTLWFMAAAPIQDPELALAIVTVNGGPKPSYLGRLVFQKYFNIEPVPELRQATPGRRYTSSKSKRYSKPKYYAKKPAKSTKTTKAKSSSKRRS